MLISRLSGLVSAKKSAAGPIFVGAGTPASSAASSVNVNYPSGIQNGDLLVLLIMGPYRAPSGWSAVGAGPNNAYKVLRSTYTSGTSVTVSTFEQAVWCRAVVLAFRNVSTTDPVPVRTNSAISGTTTITIPGITTTLPNCMVCICTFTTGDPGNPTISNWSNPNLTGLTEVTDSAAFNKGVAAACGIKTTAGATGNTTATASVAIRPGSSGAVVFAIAPAG